MSYTVDISSSSAANQFFTYNATSNVTIEVCYDPNNAAVGQPHLQFGSNQHQQQHFCNNIYLALPLDRGNSTSILPSWNIKGNIIGLVSVCIVLPIISSISLWIFTKTMLSKNPNVLYGKNGEIRKPKRFFHNQVFLLSFTFTAWYCIIMAGVIVFAVTFPYLFLTLDKYLPLVDWISIIDYIKILGDIVLIIDTLLMLLMWLPTHSLKLRVWEMYHRYTGDLEKARKYESRKKFYHKTQFIQLGFTFAFGFLLLSMMLSVSIVLVGVTAVGFAYILSSACVDIANPLNGLCLDLSDFGGQEHCGEQLVMFCNAWRGLNSTLVFWSAVTVAIGHYFLIGTGGMSFYQHIGVNLVLDAMERDEMPKDISREIESSEKCNEESEEATVSEAQSQRMIATPIMTGNSPETFEDSTSTYLPTLRPQETLPP